MSVDDDSIPIPTSIIKYDSVFDGTPKEYGFVHWDHCAKCHLTSCPFEKTTPCPIVSCPQCKVRMHECKVEDHVENICYLTIVPCLNEPFGCEKMMRRDFRANHLRKCPASVVVCAMEWNRHSLSNELKLKLKRWGHGVEEIPIFDDSSNVDAEVAFAVNDQRVLLESYRHSRKNRVRRRDRMNTFHPVIPLREIFDDPVMEMSKEKDGRTLIKSENTEEKVEYVDSSEDEKRIQAEKRRKKQAMFKNCYMCQIDPASQHLHTLGNENMNIKQLRPVKKRDYVIDKLHEKHNLTVSINTDFISQNVRKNENIKFVACGGTMYTRRCLRTVRRDEVYNHHLSQHLYGMGALSDLVVRCPNWSRGCEFSVARLKPKIGNIRFDNLTGNFMHLAMPSTSASNQEPMIPAIVLLLVANYLSNANVRTLSLVCRHFRQVIFSSIEDDSFIIQDYYKKKGENWILKKRV